MRSGTAKIEIQQLLGIEEGKRAENIGPLTRAAFDRLAVTPNDRGWPIEVDNLPSGRQISSRGLALVKHFEGLHTKLDNGDIKAYWDDTGKCWTIGYGHTGLQHKDGTVYSGRIISRARAEELLEYDMRQFEARVSALIKVSLTDDQFAALVAFDFNTGGLHKSTLLKKLNTGDYQGAADQFLRWTRSGGRVLAGLVRRRKSERNLFLGKTPYIEE